jgi:hypothetical protein
MSMQFTVTRASLDWDREAPPCADAIKAKIVSERGALIDTWVLVVRDLEHLMEVMDGLPQGTQGLVIRAMRGAPAWREIVIYDDYIES